jgi:hypothetical protein
LQEWGHLEQQAGNAEVALDLFKRASAVDRQRKRYQAYRPEDDLKM